MLGLVALAEVRAARNRRGHRRHRRPLLPRPASSLTARTSSIATARADVRCRGRKESGLLRRSLPALLALLLHAAAPAHAQTVGADSVTLRWTAVGDDSLQGTASLYDLRLAAVPMTLANWDSGTAVGGLPDPLPSGTEQQVVVRGLTRGAPCYFALRVRDAAGNWSAVSNLARWDGLDAAPPAAPSGLTAEPIAEGVQLRWDPSPAPDLAGYSIYRATGADGPFRKLNLDLLTSTAYLDDALPPGARSLWYEVTASNASSNESARSASVNAVLAGQSAGPAWSLSPAYPNPSRVCEPVRIPLEVAAPGCARLDIVDAGGHLVRRLDLSGLGGGRQEIVWDGRNDAGRAVAPGPYRAWLVAGDVRRRIRLLRIP